MGSIASNPVAAVWRELHGGSQVPVLYEGTCEGVEEAWFILPDSFRKLLLMFRDGNNVESLHCKENVIAHIRQEYDWDCGITCIQMALSFLSVEPEVLDNTITPILKDSVYTVERSWLEEKIGTKSTWSIDLVEILEQLQNTRTFHLASFEYLFCSKQLALNRSLEAMGYYTSSFAQDATRVQRLYDKLVVQSRHKMLQHDDLSLDAVLFCIRHDNCLAIMLVDNNILQSRVSSSRRSTGSFVGHYVLLLRAFDNGDVLLHDPGRPGPTMVSADDLRAAWKTPGTDSDVILLVKR